MIDLSVLIGTCDAYSPLWKNFQICFDRYWKFNTKNYIVTEKKEVPNYTDTKFTTFKGIKDPWGDRILKSLDQIDSQYVFFILDDYFLNYEYTEEQMNEWSEFIEEYDVNRMQISKSRYQKYEKIDGVKYHKLSPNSDHTISMQPSIWNVEFIRDVMENSYSPWDFEIKGTKKIKGTDPRIYADLSIPQIYFNAVRKGFKKNKNWESFKQKENLDDF